MIFSDQFRNILVIIRYKRTGYNMNIMHQTTCLLVNPITVNNFAALFNCTPACRTSDSVKAPTSKLLIKLVGAWCFVFGWASPVQLFDFCCSSVSVLALLSSARLMSCQCWILIYMFAVLMPWWVTKPSRRPNNLYVYVSHQKPRRGFSSVKPAPK